MPKKLFFKLSTYTLFLLLSVLQGCSTTPEFKTAAVDKSLTPQSVIADPGNSMGKIALWGGTILDTRNLKENTQIEVLAYPLDSSNRPLLEDKPLGRFIILHAGYLEPINYSQGKLVTVLGNISESQKGNIGEKQYTYPVIAAQQLHLWSPNDTRSNTRFNFGIGISL